MWEGVLPDRPNSGHNISTVLAVDWRVSSWFSACGSPPSASRFPPPETRSQSISQLDHGSHSGTQKQPAAFMSFETPAYSHKSRHSHSGQFKTRT